MKHGILGGICRRERKLLGNCCWGGRSKHETEYEEVKENRTKVEQSKDLA